VIKTPIISRARAFLGGDLPQVLFGATEEEQHERLREHREQVGSP